MNLDDSENINEKKTSKLITQNQDSKNFLESPEYKNILKTLNQYKKKFLEKKIEYDSKLLNFNQMMQKNISKVYSFYLEKKFLEILPILDCLESSLNVLETSEIQSKSFKINLEKIYKQFISFFKEYKVVEINQNNIPFNPSIHQAMSLDFSGKYPDNYVSHIIQKGYLLNIKLLRPALVSVSQNKILKKNN
ncbi:nucleotide exchange factor GrpE [Buchnera aphidicola]|uniref:Protein GrpE n=1 Tax=Buchnera aphidicola subsp. Tuberolachnus salignus TaxID=98804 RepID=A0A160SY56_BUCTT|nr:nucleotide exchange factor GrpE [Buchnera aphidicola]CUR53144.1 Protein GrpE [Buchnera aphidicola (Tuberolachnus salignus)]